MGVSAKAVLYGTVDPVRVEAALGRAGYVTKPLDSPEDNHRILIWPSSDLSDGARRMMYVFGPSISMGDCKYVYDGERTLCSLGASGIGPDIVRALAEEFGGYHLASDTGDDWVSAPGREPAALEPVEEMRSAIHRLLPGTGAGTLCAALAEDPERIRGLRDVLDGYLNTLDASPRP